MSAAEKRQATTEENPSDPSSLAPTQPAQPKRAKNNQIHSSECKTNPPTIVQHDEWLEARRRLQVMEKDFTRLRDEITMQVRNLPWEQVSQDYVLQDIHGKDVKFSSLFHTDTGNLLVYHFMYDPTWADKPCASCSLWNDNFAGILPHLRQRTAVVTIAKATPEQLHKLQATKQWPQDVLSSGKCTFNADYRVEPLASPASAGDEVYNFGPGWGKMSQLPAQMPGISVFHKTADGKMYRTYSVFARGLENHCAVWPVLDILPQGRQGFWPKHKEQYDAASLSSSALNASASSSASE